jgi:catechol 2,3-dioxygenase-like lactoylglutathione lyase family enzyme
MCDPHTSKVQGAAVTIVLNHTIVRAGDKDAAARFLADLLGVEIGTPTGPFIPVQVNDDLALDFDDRHPVAAGHFGFLVDDAAFDALLERLRARPHVPFGSGPEHGWDRRINRLAGGRGVYVGDPDGHSYEFFTAVPD